MQARQQLQQRWHRPASADEQTKSNQIDEPPRIALQLKRTEKLCSPDSIGGQVEVHNITRGRTDVSSRKSGPCLSVECETTS